jgi:ABC-type glycerol-3-phosphate transport system permease component
MTADRLNKIFSLVLIGVASFASLLPIALAVMNALKTTVEISTNPLAPPTSLHFENFTSAWKSAALGPSLLHSAEVAGLLSHWRTSRAPQKQTNFIKYDGELYVGEEVDKLQIPPS